MHRPMTSTTVNLDRLALSHGEGTRLDVPLRPDDLDLGGQRYSPRPQKVSGRLDVSRPSGGFAFRLRFPVSLEGPCMRCLEPAAVTVEIDAREVDQPIAGDDDLRSPYVDEGELDVSGWAHDAVALALPAQILCRPDCAGLCPVCGESLNEADPEAHRHDQGGDPRWAKLRELQ